MTIAERIGIFFLALAVVFFGLVWRDYRRSPGAGTPARRAWMRIAIIFATVGALLYLTHMQMP